MTDYFPRPAVELTLPERITIAIMRTGRTKADLAEYLGLVPSTISRWTSATSVPKVAPMRLLANESGLPIEWLMPSKEELAQLRDEVNRLTAKKEPSPDESGKGSGEYAPRDSNPEPAD